MANLKYWLWLAERKGLAGQNMVRVLEHFGTPEHVYFSDAAEYEMVEGLSRAAIQSLNDKSLDIADRILGDCDRLGYRIMTMQDAAYPERLAAIHQPPLVLYWKGRPIAFDEEAAIGIVGTRDSTPYGEMAATELAMELTRSGALIVSGIAQGIDAAAVRGALKAGGPVVSVLAGGIDIPYPREHRFLYQDVAAAGALISEHPPGTEHRGTYFPIRNRIISGLTVGVIAVESKRNGGTMHTVGHALEQNRDVFAVPGPWKAESSEGTNRLIQEGVAKLVMCGEDVLCEIRDRFPGRLKSVPPMDPIAVEQRLEDVSSKLDQTRSSPKKEVDIPSDEEYIDWQEWKTKFSDDQQAIMLALTERKSLVADDIVERTQLPARRVLSALTILQVQGYVTEESGKRFRLSVRLKME